MFFWGSYNFQAPQLTENPERPPLRYPMYVPPCTSVLPLAVQDSERAAPGAAANNSVEAALEAICFSRLHVRQVACGAKHAVLVLAIPPHHPHNERDTPRDVLVGLGSNHFGQLGHRVPSYTTTLTDLQFHDGIVSVACGARHTLLCTTTGCVYASGDNSHGQLGLPPSALQHHLRGATPATQAGSGIAFFTQLPSLLHIVTVVASHNASFALDRRGVLYAWGEAQHGHLGHNDSGERLDPSTLKLVTENVMTPRVVQWFVEHRVVVVAVAAGKAHLVCQSTEEVYTCGEPYFGKLGLGDVTPRLVPTRVVFPPRKQTERLVAIAAGDDHTLVLKENPVIGSVVYYFGKLSNADGQLTPVVVPVPSVSLAGIGAGKGNMSWCVSAEGQLYVWGKHSYNKLYNGTDAAASRAVPSLVTVLGPYVIRGMAVGGTFAVAYAESLATTAAPKEDEEKQSVKLESAAAESSTSAAEHPVADDSPVGDDAHAWDVVVPHDARVGARPQGADGDPEEQYERGVRCFLAQYLGERLAVAYVAGMPAAPPRTEAGRYQFGRRGAHNLSIGQKVRLWMTDVYALATVTALLEVTAAGAVAGAAPAPATTFAPSSPETAATANGRRVQLEWQRDDWHDEAVTLYSNDETLDEANENRWQPFWFAQDAAGNYLIAKSSGEQ